MKYLIISILLCLPMFVAAQETPESINEGPMTLQQRFGVMKEKSQTFKDYKVIKQNVLEGFWKITMDSVQDQRRRITEGLGKIDELDKEVAALKSTIAERDSSLAEMEYDGTHIRVLGIDAHKTAFTTVAGFIILGLLVVVGLMLVRVRYVSSDIKERKDQVDVLTREYEEYKRNSLDKQMRLSRELQDERNKLAELGH